MANGHMRYRYTRAFIVEGLLAREGQEIVLFDQPAEGLKFVLTGTPDSLLADADKSTAAGISAISRITVAGAPQLPPLLPLSVIVGQIRSERTKLIDGRMVFACQFEGTAAAETGAPLDEEGERFLILNRGAIDQITAKHEKDIDRAIGMCVRRREIRSAIRAVRRKLQNDHGKQLGMSGCAFWRNGIGGFQKRYGCRSGKLKLKSRFERCFRSGKDLKTVTRLLSDSLLAKEDRAEKLRVGVDIA